MNLICKWLRPREEVLLYDNGLRIESTIRILSNNKWRSRYCVCQRRTATEAPLIGIFKNDRAREKGDHIDLFYLQNYIGYEYGFKFKKTNKTLAVLVQGQTLVFSFCDVEHMMFWKEWLKDVCGRSAMFFMNAGVYPQNTSIIRLRSKEVRIHITRLALVVVQDMPPNQCLFLCLEDLFDVQCYENRFVFRALAYSWAYPHEFLFYSEQVPELSLKLQCLLKAKQFYNHQKNSIDPSRFSAPVNALGKASVGSESATLSQEGKKRKAHPPMSAPPSFSIASENRQRSAHGESNEKSPLLSSNEEREPLIYGNESVKKAKNSSSETSSILQRPSTLSMQQIAEVLNKPVKTNSQVHPILENEFDNPTQNAPRSFATKTMPIRVEMMLSLLRLNKMFSRFGL
uniref:PH domain-containing protein n=1 Tax=Ditylenchus dipsaci TaxID=166011 RepID=A0A915D4E8_9BILA